MSKIRAPSVAGKFYPADAVILGRWINQFLTQATTQALPVKAVVVPHAGYQYSGAVAATAYAGLRHLAPEIRRIVLIGPAHRLGFRGIAAPSADAFATPLGPVPVDRAAVDSVVDGAAIRVIDQAFDGEHDLEVQLPFLQTIFHDFEIVPLLVGGADPALVENLLERLWGGPETLIVISSDLSHYHDSETARRLDLGTSQMIEALAPERLCGDFACGHTPIAGLLRRAGALDLRATTLDLRNSGDTAGSSDRVVGYGAYGFEYAATARLSEDHRARLTQVARNALDRVAAGNASLDLKLAAYPLALKAIRKTFVTLELDGRLRGCIGSVQPVQPLVTDVAANTIKAATLDPRFGPVTADEAGRIAITISILSHPRPIPITSEADLVARLHPDVDGLILREGQRQALFLPKVWHDLPHPLQFVRQLKMKAGLPAEHFSKDLQAFRFTTETF